MAEELTPPTPEEMWKRIASPEKKAAIIIGVVQNAMALGLSRIDAGKLFSGLNDKEADALAHGFGGLADGDTLRMAATRLKGDETKP